MFPWAILSFPSVLLEELTLPLPPKNGLAAVFAGTLQWIQPIGLHCLLCLLPTDTMYYIIQNF